ncbi:MAG: serine/threonine-protein kinase, partial [Candidatus Eisenbacteria bacterium]|nr:serine/threonine-protein kinase [Candidatus Eisenbacteria bacterium]
MSLTPGTKLGPYEVVAPLGAGGMGEVYRAHDTRLDRDVAIKVLPSHLSANPEVRARFEREAKAVAALNHPNICVLHDVGREGDTDYLVMELIEGETLSQRLTRGALPPAEVLRLGAQIADALDRAHRAGVIHRDLKPGNVMLTKSGAKLMDFGLARATASAGPVSASGATMAALTQHPTVASPLTAAGTIVGTFQYMSPEQLEGLESDARADLWALGCVLYEMATGKRAFAGASQASLISAIMKEEPRSLLESLADAPSGGIAAHLDRLVRQCLAKDAEQRLQSARDVKLQLEWIAGAGSQSSMAAPAVAPRHRNRERTLWAYALLLVAASAFIAFQLLRPGTKWMPIEAAILPPPQSEFSSSFARPQPVAISPDGTTLVFCARTGEGADVLWVRRLASGEARALPGTDGASAPFFSPDGRSVGFFTDRKLMRVDLAGGPAIALADVDDGRGGTWGKGGDILFAPRGAGALSRISADGGAVAEATLLDTAAAEATHRYPVFLPDGEHFLFLARGRSMGGENNPHICVGSLKSPKHQRVIAAASNPAYASGHLLFVRDAVLMAQPFDVRKLATTGAAVPIAEDLRWDQRFGRGVFAVSGNGVLAYMTGKTRSYTQLAWLDRDGKRIARVGDPASYTYGGSPEISPDGSMAVMTVLNDEKGSSSVQVVELANGRRRRVTSDELDHPVAHWSRDRILTVDNSTARAVFWTVGGAIVDSVSLPAGSWPMASSPDGEHLLRWYPSTIAHPGIVAVETRGAHAAVAVTDTSERPSSGQFSPDGRFIAYEGVGSGRSEVYVVPFPPTGQKWQVSQSGGVEPRWNRNGRELLFFDPANHLMSAEVTLSPGALQVGQIR